LLASRRLIAAVTTAVRPLRISYVLPLKWSDDDGLDELLAYLAALRDLVEVIVVDGSAEPLFSQHGRLLGEQVRHLAPDPDHACPNGKVAGVRTGVAVAKQDYIVVADDDVRYRPEQLELVERLLDRADLVRPLNVFLPMPWHARWDSARTLINCAVGADYPGTLAFRVDCYRMTDGYAGDVLFENLEPIRTLTAAGAVELRDRRLVVRRLPPTAGRFAQQRVRQAYDSLAQPARLAAELAILPAAMLLRRRSWLLAALAVGLAGAGRLRAGRQHFPADIPLWAPAWLLERGVCAWLAVALRLRGGVGYSGSRIRIAAHSMRCLRRRIATGRITRR
jgi:hypothetical protein